jgi:hypothetical protein
VTTQVQWVRAQANINLMEIAAREGMEEEFDRLYSELASATLSPMHRADFLLFRGEGLGLFGRLDAAEETLRDAVAFASANEFHQIAFAAENALTALRVNRARGGASVPVRDSAVTIDHELEMVTKGLTQLREAAFAASPNQA